MKISINKKNKIIQNTCKDTELTGAKFHYYLSSDNKLYKEVVKNGDIAMFQYNQNNGKFDIPVDMNNLNLVCEKINRQKFYSEVLNIIKRKSILEYMTKSNVKFDLKNLYISEQIKRNKLANDISDKTKTVFTETDARILVDNICESTKIPLSLVKKIKKALIETFYDKEMSHDKIMLLVNKIITKELQKKLPDFTNEAEWNLEYYKMITKRQRTLALYSKKSKQL